MTIHDCAAQLRQEANAQQARCIENMTEKLNAAHDVAAMHQSQVPKWISVEEKLPHMGEVLISHCGHVCIAWHHGQGKFETGSRMMLVVGKHSITHWMPLPEPPKEERE